MLNIVEFCKKCGGIMVPKKLKTTTVIACRACGTRRSMKRNERVLLREKIQTKPSESVVVMEKNTEMDALPITKTECPKCSHNEAHWWIQQTRSADEPPTRFLACAKCGHRWREYD